MYKNLSKKVYKSASYDLKNNINKDAFNIKVCNAMKKQNSKTVLILDGKQMRTTRYCVDMGIKKENITSIEKIRSCHNLHLKNGINSINSDVWLVINQPNSYEPYNTLNLDAVSSIDTVSKNIENIFRNNFLSDKSVLALTVTKRSRIKGSNCHTDLDNLKKTIKKYASKYNYSINLDSEQEQIKVFSMIYTVEKINNFV